MSEKMQHGCLLVGKFLLFDLFWCLQTTFTSFSTPELYVNGLLVGLLLLLPYVLTKRESVFIIISLALDLLLMANLMYNRTYNSAIPLNSYLLSGNLRDFLPSVVDSLRWYDFLLPLSTLLFALGRKRLSMKAKGRCFYWRCLGVSALLSVTLVMMKGGLVKAMDSLQTPNDYTCGCPMYTVFGCMLYDAVKQQEELTDERKSEITGWLDARPVCQPLPDSIGKRRNLILILCESLESWVIDREVEGPTTLYAPYVLTQVKGGRSIDCQLMINAGMLPIRSGSFAFEFPFYDFHTLTKAMKEKYQSESCLLTVDKPIIWNQGIIASAFGIERVISREDWQAAEEGTGPRKNLADEPFFRQSVAKMQKGEVWPVGKHAFLQFVTYSGHGSFKLPEQMQRLHFPDSYQEKLRDYMITANYTDHALSLLLDYVQSRPDYQETMVVIVGDHEGLASDRAALCQSEKGRGLVSDKQFTPLIIVNSPIGMRYDDVMGQIDIYPTLLQLMGLDDYSWKGLGQSILDEGKYPVAVAPDMHVEGDAASVPQQEIERLRRAYDISDMMLRYDYQW